MGLFVLMASAVVVLKHETSTLRQRHNCISIDLKFGVGYYVRDVTSPVKFGSDTIGGRDRCHVGVTYAGPVTFVFLFFNRATAQWAHTREPTFAHNSSKSVWCKEDPFWEEKYAVVNLGVFYPKNPPKKGRQGQLPAKIKFDGMRYAKYVNEP